MPRKKVGGRSESIFRSPCQSNQYQLAKPTWAVVVVAEASIPATLGVGELTLNLVAQFCQCGVQSIALLECEAVAGSSQIEFHLTKLPQLRLETRCFASGECSGSDPAVNARLQLALRYIDVVIVEVVVVVVIELSMCCRCKDAA